MTNVDINSQTGKNFRGDVLIIPVFSGRERHKLPLTISKVARQLMDEGDFNADYLETIILHHPNGARYSRWMILLGLGDEERLTCNKIRKAYGSIVATVLTRRWHHLGIITPITSNLEHDEVQKTIIEGMLLANYNFNKFKSNTKIKKINNIEIFTNGADTRKTKRCLNYIKAGIEACHLVRDMVNTPANELYPETFVQHAQMLAEQHKLNINVLEPKELQKDNFNAILAVGSGSQHTPRVIKLEYQPNEKTKRHIVLVGKGITFDSGGLSLKDATSMEHMKGDMAGAAIVLATLIACAQTNTPVAVTGIIGLAENIPSSKSYKPGDVIKSRSGKTIEILNTDAEGRVMLADLLNYASELEADHIVDLATLTGSCMGALGDCVSGIMSNDQALTNCIIDSGSKTGEYLWQLPIIEDYAEELKSNVADLKNAAKTRWGGAIIAALFLKEFVKNKASWAHIDLSSSWSSVACDYKSIGATGEGPRWLLDWINS